MPWQQLKCHIGREGKKMRNDECDIRPRTSCRCAIFLIRCHSVIVLRYAIASLTRNKMMMPTSLEARVGDESC